MLVYGLRCRGMRWEHLAKLGDYFFEVRIGMCPDSLRSAKWPNLYLRYSVRHCL